MISVRDRALAVIWLRTGPDSQEVRRSKRDVSEGDLVHDISGVLSDLVVECPENVCVGWVMPGIVVRGEADVHPK